MNPERLLRAQKKTTLNLSTCVYNKQDLCRTVIMINIKYWQQHSSIHIEKE